jgi:hypothetical protein
MQEAAKTIQQRRQNEDGKAESKSEKRKLHCKCFSLMQKTKSLYTFGSVCVSGSIYVVN